MNKSELARQVTHYHQREIRHWLAITTIIIALTLITCSMVTAYQYYTYRTLATTVNALEQMVTKKAKDLVTHRQKSKLHKQLLRHQSYVQAYSMSALLSSIADKLPPKTFLTEFTCTHQTISLKGYASTIEELHAFMQNFNAPFLERFVLTTMEQHPVGISFTVTADIKKQISR